MEPNEGGAEGREPDEAALVKAKVEAVLQSLARAIISSRSIRMRRGTGISWKSQRPFFLRATRRSRTCLVSWTGFNFGAHFTMGNVIFYTETRGWS